MMLVLLVTVTIAMAVTTARANTSPNDPSPSWQLHVSFIYAQGSHEGIYEARQSKQTAMEPRLEPPIVNVVPCEMNGKACRKGGDVFKEGCCLGEDCPEDTISGKQCPVGAC